jgi:endonuclease YncB( thermonuclease family)
MMRSLVCLLILLLALPAWASVPKAKPEQLKFERALDSATIQASGKTISLWGVKAIPPKNRYSWASKLYLESMLAHGKLVCLELRKAGGIPVDHCTIDTADVGSLLVQMGMALADSPYYKGEEIKARSRSRGIWKMSSRPM